MRTVMVLGSGYMGSGIAQVCANSGYEVLLWDLNTDLLNQGIDKIEKGLDQRIAKGKETLENKQKILSNIIKTTGLQDAHSADFIIEVVLENFEVKQKILTEVEEYTFGDTYIGTNTSYLSITKLANCLKRPERFLGTHFFGPVPAMKLIEIIRGEKTSDETVDVAKDFSVSIGKIPVVIEKDSPGFIVNRINAAIRMEAYRCYAEGIASIEDIDTAMKLGLNHPMGPFELNDLSGIEIGISGLETLYRSFEDDRWRPIAEAYERIEKGELGRKTGKGWYDYTGGKKAVREDLKKGRSK